MLFLVDLASTTSVHTSLDRSILARTLRDAGTAFASLIYEMRTTDTLSVFVRRCKKCFSHLESDRRVGDKLLALLEQVPVLDEIKKMKGSVEMNSLRQAKLINERGVYLIQNTRRAHMRQRHEQQQRKYEEGAASSSPPANIFDEFGIEMETSGGGGGGGDGLQEALGHFVSLTLKVDATAALPQPVNKTYSFDELNELQNILMLLSNNNSSSSDTGDGGQGADENERIIGYFTRLFAQVTAVAELLVHLVQHGCFFFDDVTAHVYCDMNRTIEDEDDNTARPSLCMSSPHLTSERGSSANDALVRLTGLLGESLSAWLAYCSTLRDQYHCLNSLTIDQIKYLCLHMSKLFVNATKEDDAVVSSKNKIRKN